MKAASSGTEHRLVLPDGRTLAWYECGDPDGEPIVALHGNPGSRLFWHRLPNTRDWQGVRLIAPDRPGFGRSTFGPGLIEWTDDLRTLLDHLQIDRCRMIAVSGGAPAGLASAWRLPDRVGSLALVGPVGPLAPGVTEGMNSNRYLFSLGRWLPGLVRLQMGLVARQMRTAPGRVVDLLRRKLPERDLELLDDPSVRRALEADFQEACAQGGAAMAAETLYPSRWPIPLKEIDVPVTVWQGDQDRSVGRMGQWIAAHIPGARFIGLPGEGHLWLLTHIREPVDALLEDDVAAVHEPAAPEPSKATSRHPNSFAAISDRVAAGQVSAPAVWAMLFARTALFAVWQTLFALVFLVQGDPHPWTSSLAWWPVVATLAGFTNLALLASLAKAEGLRLRDLYGFNRPTWRGDLAFTGALLLASVPIVALPMTLLATALWGDPEVPNAILVQPLPVWGVVAALGFPVTIALTEMPTYLFVVHRLRAMTSHRWTMLLLVGAMASAQHVTLPLVFDPRFVVFRLFALLPVSLFWVATMDRRPTMLPFMMVMHGLLDALVVVALASAVFATGQG